MSDEQSKEPTIEEQLAAIDAEEALERKADLERAQKKRIERHRLKKKYEQELKGREGEAFVIIDTSGGFIVIKKPEAILWKAFKNSERNDADVEALIRPNVVFPEWAQVARIFDDYAGAIDLVTGPMVRMIDVILGDRQKK